MSMSPGALSQRGSCDEDTGLLEGPCAEAQPERGGADRQAHPSNSHPAQREGLACQKGASKEKGGLQTQVEMFCWVLLTVRL